MSVKDLFRALQYHQSGQTDREGNGPLDAIASGIVRDAAQDELIDDLRRVLSLPELWVENRADLKAVDLLQILISALGDNERAAIVASVMRSNVFSKATVPDFAWRVLRILLRNGGRGMMKPADFRSVTNALRSDGGLIWFKIDCTALAVAREILPSEARREIVTMLRKQSYDAMFDAQLYARLPALWDRDPTLVHMVAQSVVSLDGSDLTRSRTWLAERGLPDVAIARPPRVAERIDFTDYMRKTIPLTHLTEGRVRPFPSSAKSRRSGVPRRAHGR